MIVKKIFLMACLILVFILCLDSYGGKTSAEKEQADTSLMLLIVVNSCCSLKVERLAKKISIAATIGNRA